MAGKKYYWAKIMANFFDRLEIRQLRAMPGGIGEILCLVAIRIQLSCLQDDGEIRYKGVCGNIEEEIALGIMEDQKNVELALNWLQKRGWAVKTEYGYNVAFLDFGSECESAERVRKFRSRTQKNELEAANIHKTLQCNACLRHNVTTETETEQKTEKEQQQQEDETEHIIEKYRVQKTVEILASQGFSEQKINTGLLLLAAAKNVKNPGAWLRKAVEQDWQLDLNTIQELNAKKKVREARVIALR